MLYRKMLRDMKHNFMQFLSIFILSFLAIFVYAGIASSNVGINATREEFHKNTNLASAWIYGNQFSEQDLEAVSHIEGVTGAQLRTKLVMNGQGEDSPAITVYMQKENQIIKPYTMEGKDYDPDDAEGIWLNNRFAEENNIHVGDSYDLKYQGITLHKTIRGLIMSPEYEYYVADSDIEPDFKKSGYAYVSENAFDGYTQDSMMQDSMMQDSMVQDSMMQAPMTQIPMTQILITSDKEDVMSLEDQVSDALHGNYAIMADQSSQSGLKVLDDEMAQHEAFAFVFPAVFVIIAILSIMTTMNRIVSEQRTQIGTLKALGTKKRKIMFHYISYSLGLSVLGAIVGLILGPIILAPLFSDFMPTMYTLPEWRTGYTTSFIVVALLIVVACCGATYYSCHKILKVNPADTLRPEPPKSGRACIFEHLPFWSKLGFSNQYNLRDISRAKLRAFMCLFGTVSGMMLLVAAMGANDSVGYVSDWEFNKLTPYQNQILFVENTTTEQADTFAEDNHGELVLTDGIEISKDHTNQDNQKDTVATNVCEEKGFFQVTDTSLKERVLHKGEIAITMKLADKLGVKVGDTVEWHLYNEDQWTSSTITMINRNPQFTGITMTRDDYVKTGHSFQPTMCITGENQVKGADQDIVKAVFSKTMMKESFEKSMSSMTIMVVSLVVVAILLTIIVLYNSGTLSYNERQKELATLKVMGFSTGRIRRLLFLQNLWLSLLGIIFGIPLGKVLLQYMFDSNGDSFDFIALITPQSYVISALVVLGTSTLVSIAFSRRLKKLDMVASLKGLE